MKSQAQFGILWLWSRQLDNQFSVCNCLNTSNGGLSEVTSSVGHFVVLE